MNVLLIYATYSSGTYTASGVVMETLKENGHEVTRKTAKDVDPTELGNYDLVIMGSPSWEVEDTDGMPHIHFVELMKKLEGSTFEDRNFAIFGLGEDHYARFCGAVDHLEEFVKKVHGKLIANSLRINGFFFDEEKNSDLIRHWVNNLPLTK